MSETEPDRVIMQSAVTKDKHPRHYAWWRDGEGDKAATIRVALDFYWDVLPQMARIENMLRLLVELSRGDDD